MKGKEMLYVYIGVAPIAVFFISKILKRLGILKSQDKIDRAEDVKELRKADYFNPLYYREVPHKPMAKNQLKDLAKDVRKATRGFGTDEELLYSTFKKLYNKINISELSEVFYEEYGKDMRATIFKELNDKEKQRLWVVIEGLPNF